MGGFAVDYEKLSSASSSASSGMSSLKSAISSASTMTSSIPSDCPFSGEITAFASNLNSEYNKLNEEYPKIEDTINRITVLEARFNGDKNELRTFDEMSDEANMLDSFFSSLVVADTSIMSGIMKIYENIDDGFTWLKGKQDSGLLWLGAQTVGLLGFDGTKANILSYRQKHDNQVKQQIAVDRVGEANRWFYEGTNIGRTINNASYLKYDSAAAEKIQAGTEFVGEFAAATALTIATGGAAAPLVVGTFAGAGYAAENTYRVKTNTTLLDEAKIGVSSALNGLSWMAKGKLGQGAIEIGKDIIEKGGVTVLKNAVSQLTNRDFLASKLKEGLFPKLNNKLNLNAIMNYTSAAMATAGSIPRYLTGEEDFSLTSALKLGGEYLWYLGLNVLEDIGRDYVSGYRSNSLLNSKLNELTTDAPIVPEVWVEKTYLSADQDISRKYVRYVLEDTSWLENNEDELVTFLQSKGFDYDTDIKPYVLTPLKEGTTVNNFVYSLVQDYLNQDDKLLQKYNNDVVEISRYLENSKVRVENPEFIRLRRTLTKKGLDYNSATQILDRFNTSAAGGGNCSYAARANLIFDSFDGQEELFKKKFGFDMYVDIDGIKRKNTNELILDMYTNANIGDDADHIFKLDNNRLTINNINAARIRMDNSNMEEYLESKRIYSHFSGGGYIGVDNNDISDLQNISDNKKVILNVFGSKIMGGEVDHPVILRDLNSNYKQAISGPGGHAVYLSGYDDTGFIVDSWGGKYRINYDDLISNDIYIMLLEKFDISQ